MTFLATSVLLVHALLGQAAKDPPKSVATPLTPFHVIQTFTIGGDGMWDCIEVDPDAHRLYIPRSTHLMVLDTQTGQTVGDIVDTAGVHDVALAPALGKGFTSNGKSDDITVFDLKTLKPIKTIKAGKNPDAIVFEPITKRVFCFNAKGNNVTVVAAEDLTVVGTIELGGNPELTTIDGKGHVFVNVENTSELLRIDAKTMKIEQRIALAPGEEPTGIAIDSTNNRLFCACANNKMVVVDAVTGKILATPAIGGGVDGAGFDEKGKFALSSNGEGTMTVVATSGDKPFEVVQTLVTAKGARTMTVDPKSHLVYMPTADFETPSEPTKEGAKAKRPKMKLGSFKVIVVGS